MPKVLVLLYDGFEEIEAMTLIDVLRRAGVVVTTAGIPGNIITSAQGVRVHADVRLVDVDPERFDALALPGGPGYGNLLKSDTAIRLIRAFGDKGKLIGAICAAPLALHKAGLLKGKRATAYPGLEKVLDMPRAARVVVDGNIVTSQGPGTALEFALKLVELLVGAAKAEELKVSLLAK